jgi:predicted 2-oxoglutarate/Fe(II)-dependent dioxygenase YbiX
MSYSFDDPVGPGDRALDFVLPDPDGKPINLYTGVRGGIPLLMFYPDMAMLQAEAPALLAMADELVAMKVHPFVAVNAPHSSLLPMLGKPFFVVHDTDGATLAAYGLRSDGEALTLRFDPNLRLMGLRRSGVKSVRHFLDQMKATAPEDSPRLVHGVAPVLIVPHVLSPTFCEELIRQHNEQGNVPSTVTYQKDGVDVQEVFLRQKIRHDHNVIDAVINRRLDNAFTRRVNIEIWKAFNFQVSAREPFNVVRYDGDEKGHFAVHRDNTTPTSAHMRFAVTVNLNPDDYDGGNLRFPEYSNDLYAPPMGGAIVFSCSHLHEATPVTRGTRYALLVFLFGPEGARQRAETLKTLEGQHKG